MIIYTKHTWQWWPPLSWPAWWSSVRSRVASTAEGLASLGRAITYSGMSSTDMYYHHTLEYPREIPRHVEKSKTITDLRLHNPVGWISCKQLPVGLTRLCYLSGAHSIPPAPCEFIQLARLRDLCTLELTHMFNLDHIPQSLHLAPSLHTLRLDHISGLRVGVHDVPTRLQTLAILHAFEMQSFTPHLPYLERLVLMGHRGSRHNGRTNVQLIGCRSIRYLSVRNICFASLSFIDIPRGAPLEILKLSGCTPIRIPVGNHSLSVLHIAGEGLWSHKDVGAIPNLRELSVVRMSDPPIRALSSSLVVLRLSGCQLLEIPSVIMRIHSLLTLKLVNNRIQCIPTGTWTLPRNLSVLDLSGNPITCVLGVTQWPPDLIRLRMDATQVAHKPLRLLPGVTSLEGNVLRAFACEPDRIRGAAEVSMLGSCTFPRLTTLCMGVRRVRHMVKRHPIQFHEIRQREKNVGFCYGCKEQFHESHLRVWRQRRTFPPIYWVVCRACHNRLVRAGLEQVLGNGI